MIMRTNPLRRIEALVVLTTMIVKFQEVKT